MGMSFCRGCGAEIHDSAMTCPQCGASQKTVSNNSTDYISMLKKHKKRIIISVIAIIVIFVPYSVYSYFKSSSLIEEQRLESNSLLEELEEQRLVNNNLLEGLEELEEQRLYEPRRGQIVYIRELRATKYSLGIYDIAKHINSSAADYIATLASGLSFSEAMEHEGKYAEMQDISKAFSSLRQNKRDYHLINSILQNMSSSEIKSIGKIVGEIGKNSIDTMIAYLATDFNAYNISQNGKDSGGDLEKATHRYAMTKALQEMLRLKLGIDIFQDSD